MRWRFLRGPSWSRAGFFGIFPAVGPTRLLPPSRNPQRNAGLSSSTTSTLSSPFFFLTSEFSSFLGHSLSLSLFTFKGILVDKVPCCNVCLPASMVWLERPLLVRLSNNLPSSCHRHLRSCEEQEEIWGQKVMIVLLLSSISLLLLHFFTYWTVQLFKYSGHYCSVILSILPFIFLRFLLY